MATRKVYMISKKNTQEEPIALPKSLSNAENNKLFTEYEKCKEYLQQLPKDSDKRIELEKLILEIRNKIVLGNMSLIYNLISNRKTYLFKELEEDDIYQIAYELLIKFVENYDISKGITFYKYVYNFLIHHVCRAIDENKQIHIPEYLKKDINLVTKVKENIEATRGQATIEDIANELGWSYKKVSEILEAINSNNIESYNYKLEDDVDEEIDGYEFACSTEIEVLNRELNENIARIFKILNKREVEILKLHYGFYNNKTYTLEEIRKIYGVSKPRINQIKQRALKKIRQSIYIKYIDGYQEELNKKIYLRKKIK